MKERKEDSFAKSSSATRLPVVKEVSPRKMVLDMLKKHNFGIEGYELPPPIVRSPRPSQIKS